MRIDVINGPNLNLLGAREQSLYGSDTLEELERRLAGEFHGIELVFFQSNHEGELVDHIQQLKQTDSSGIVINAASFTHTSVAIRDALLAVTIPFVEVHITNVYAREEFRQSSFLSDMAEGVIVGLGTAGYEYAILHLTKT